MRQCAQDSRNDGDGKAIEHDAAGIFPLDQAFYEFHYHDQHDAGA